MCWQRRVATVIELNRVALAVLSNGKCDGILAGLTCYNLFVLVYAVILEKHNKHNIVSERVKIGSVWNPIIISTILSFTFTYIIETLFFVYYIYYLAYIILLAFNILYVHISCTSFIMLYP